MTEPNWTNGYQTLYHADARRLPLADQSVHCVVTSPPYWGLRDYELGEGGIGLESTLDDWVMSIVDVMREVWRVLRDDGTCWLNLGDAYVGSGKGMYADGRHSHGPIQSTHRGSASLPVRNKRSPRGAGGGRWGGGDLRVDGLQTKNLMLQPARVALALQQPWWTCTECEETHHQTAFGYWPDGRLICPVCLETHNVRLAQRGWIVRSAPIWHKINAMPESARDRPTSSYEQIYLLVKSNKPIHWVHEDGRSVFRAPAPDYRWVHEETEEQIAAMPPGWSKDNKMGWNRVNQWKGLSYFYDGDAVRSQPNPESLARQQRRSQRQAAELIPMGPTGAGFDRRAAISDTKYDTSRSTAGRLALHRQAARQQGFEYAGMGANLRDVWPMPTTGRSEKHYATFPEELPRLCILAGTSEHGVCQQCGAPWRRIVSRTLAPTESAHEHLTTAKGNDGANVRGDGMAYNGFRPGMVSVAQTLGWQPSCDCGAERVPATVLDPFAGVGTTLAVAQSLGRMGVGVDLQPKYLGMGSKRLGAINLPLPLF